MRIELKSLPKGEIIDCYVPTVCGKDCSKIPTRMYISVHPGYSRQDVEKVLSLSNLTLDDVCEDCLRVLDNGKT